MADEPNVYRGLLAELNHARQTQQELEIFELAEEAGILPEQLIFYLDQFTIANVGPNNSDAALGALHDLRRWIWRRAIWQRWFDSTGNKPAAERLADMIEADRKNRGADS